MTCTGGVLLLFGRARLARDRAARQLAGALLEPMFFEVAQGAWSVFRAWLTRCAPSLELNEKSLRLVVAIPIGLYTNS